MVFLRNQSNRGHKLPPCHDIHPFDRGKFEEYNDAEVLAYYLNKNVFGRKLVASKQLNVSPTDNAPTQISECYPLEYVLYFRPSFATVQTIHKAHPKAIESIDPSNGWTVLHRAIYYQCCEDVVLYLVEQCPPYLPAKAETTNQWTPLHFACLHVCPPLVLEKLIEKTKCNKKKNSAEPISLSQQSSSGFTVLHFAIVGQPETTEDKIHKIQLLLQADPTLILAPNEEGCLPHTLARDKSVYKSLKTAFKIASLGKDDYTTRHALEAAIAKCQDHTSKAGGGTMTATTMDTTEAGTTTNSTVNTSATPSSSTTVITSVIAQHTIQILVSKRKKVQSLEEIDQLTATLVDRRDKAIAENQMLVAERLLESILKLDMRKAEEHASSDDSSRQIVDGLECKGSWKAAQVSLPFLRQATNNFDPSGDCLLGSGGFGDVYRGVDPKGGTTFAVKRIKDEIMKSKLARESVKQKALAEIKKLSELHHPNIVRLLGYHISDKPAEDQCLVYELYGGGSLANLLKTAEGRNKLDWRLRVKTATCIASALVYLHSKATFHRDVKPGNICFSESLDKVVLIDYGIAIIMDENNARTSVEVTSVVGTRSYMAPEYKDTGIYRAECDVFSLGVVLRTLLSGNTKIEHPGPADVDIMAGDWDLTVLTELQQLMAQCCAIQPQSRPTMQELHDRLLHTDQRSQPALDEEEEATIDEELTKSRMVSGRGDDVGRKGDCMCGLAGVQGLVCLQVESPHFCCHSCFREHLTENLGEDEIHCRAPGCGSVAYTLDQIKDHASPALLSKHLQFQRKNSQAITGLALGRFLEKMEKRFDKRLDRAVSKLMRGQELLGKDELSCPTLCFIVPTKANRGKQGFMSMVHSLRDLAQTSLLLYFVCAYDKKPVWPPLRLYKNKAWVKKVAPAIHLSILIVSVALQISKVAEQIVQIPVPGFNLKEQLGKTEALVSEFVSTEDAATIERFASSISSGSDSSAFSLQATKLVDTAYQVIKEATEGDSEWRKSMVLVQCKKTGEFGWVRKSNAEKWEKSL